MAGLVPVTVMSYNVQGIPSFLLPISNLSTRLNHIARYILKIVNKYGVDVLILQELFSTKLYKKIKESLKSVMQHDTKVTDKVDSVDFWAAISKPILSWFSFIQGGVIIFSKHPIVDNKQLVFSSGIHSDKLGSKGAILARIMVDRSPVDVVGLHLQAHHGPEEHKVRKSQITQLVKWLSSKKRGSLSKARHLRDGEDVPLIIAGDFNSCLIHDKKETKELLDILEVIVNPIFGYKAPVASYSNVANDFCDFQNEDDDYDHVYDYILASPSATVLQPQTVVTDAMDSPVVVYRRALWCIDTDERKISHVSDHFPVYAKVGVKARKASRRITK